jgi:hypothetical protein
LLHLRFAPPGETGGRAAEGKEEGEEEEGADIEGAGEDAEGEDADTGVQSAVATSLGGGIISCVSPRLLRARDAGIFPAPRSLYVLPFPAVFCPLSPPFPAIPKKEEREEETSRP